MVKPSLGTRLFEAGNPNPEFASKSSVNWMRALAILTSTTGFSTSVATIVRRASAQPVTAQETQDNAFEKLFLAESYLAALRALTAASNPYDVARVAIVAWYYCIYFSSQAMLAIAAQPVPEQHAKTARVWLNLVVTGPATPLVPYPFDLNITTLVKAQADKLCDALKRGTDHQLRHVPTTEDEAHDAHVAYLKGSCGWYRGTEEGKVRCSREFVNAGHKDFRTGAARLLRDSTLARRGVGFLDMAIRYRGKANYRDAIFLCYGSHGNNMARFLADTRSVADAFYRMAMLWVSARIPSADWQDFASDLQANSKLTGNPG